MTERLRLGLIFGVLGVIGAAYWWRSTTTPASPGPVPVQATLADTSSAPTRRSAVDGIKEALRDLAVGQEAYYAEHNRYAATLEELQEGPGGYYHATSGVTLVLQATAAGWSAVASSTSTDTTCTLAMPPEGPEGGVPKC